MANTYKINFATTQISSLTIDIKASSEEKAIKKLYAMYVKGAIKEIKRVTQVQA